MCHLRKPQKSSVTHGSKIKRVVASARLAESQMKSSWWIWHFHLGEGDLSQAGRAVGILTTEDIGLGSGIKRSAFVEVRTFSLHVTN